MTGMNADTLPERAGNGSALTVDGVTVNRRYVLMESWEDWYASRGKTIGASDLAHFLITGKPRGEFKTNEYLDSILKFGNDYEPYVYENVCHKCWYVSRPTSSPLSSLVEGEASQHDLSYYQINHSVHASLDSCFNGGTLATQSDPATGTKYGVVEIKTGGAETLGKLTASRYNTYCAQAVIEALCCGASNAYIAYANRPKDYATMTHDDIRKHLKETTVLSGNLLAPNGDAHTIRIHPSLGDKTLAELTVPDLIRLAHRYREAEHLNEQL